MFQIVYVRLFVELVLIIKKKVSKVNKGILFYGSHCDGSISDLHKLSNLMYVSFDNRAVLYSKEEDLKCLITVKL